MLRVKKGDYGIKINVAHNAAGTVKYSLDGQTPQNLVGNTYLVLDASATATEGTHTISFIDTGTGTHVTANEQFMYVVY